MSQFDLSDDTIRQLPAYPGIAQSLMLIQTQKFFGFNSVASFKAHQQQLEDPESSQVSMELRIQKEVISSTSTLKKKKGGCTCKKTKCLKMYCECFSTGKICGPDCNCYGCMNNEEHEEDISRANEMIKIKSGDLGRAVSGKGCNCRKSHCSKKYCQCYNAGIACGPDCRCLSCENVEGVCDKNGKEEAKEIMLSKIIESFIE